MSAKAAENRDERLEEAARFANVPSWRERHENDIEPPWERFYDEGDWRDGYEGYREEVER